jgi:hypothetical protein
MFALSMGAGTNTAFTDVCKTPSPTGVTPIPYPDVNLSATSVPAAFNVLMGCTPALNKMSMGMISNGDEPGCAMGVVSNLIDGQTTYQVGCVTIFAGGTPVQRLTSVTGQNGAGPLMNTPGMTAVPSQVSVLTLG